MVRTPVNTASLVLLSLQKGAEHLAGESKEQQERLRNQTSKSDRADASMTGVNAMRSHDMTVMHEPLSKPQSQLCKLFSTGRFRQGTGAVFRCARARRD
jgi:hypothetical protein